MGGWPVRQARVPRLPAPTACPRIPMGGEEDSKPQKGLSWGGGGGGEAVFVKPEQPAGRSWPLG